MASFLSLTILCDLNLVLNLVADLIYIFNILVD